MTFNVIPIFSIFPKKFEFKLLASLTILTQHLNGDGLFQGKDFVFYKSSSFAREFVLPPLNSNGESHCWKPKFPNYIFVSQCCKLIFTKLSSKLLSSLAVKVHLHVRFCGRFTCLGYKTHHTAKLESFCDRCTSLGYLKRTVPQNRTLKLDM